MAKARTTKAAEAKTDAPKITIDGKEYAVDALSDEAKKQIANLRVTDAEIQRLNNQRAILQTARNSYAAQLSAALSEAK